MPVRYSAMNKTTGTGPSSMMAAIMVTAATCNQNEKIEKQTTTIYPSEDVNKLKVLSTGKFTCKHKYLRRQEWMEKHTKHFYFFFFIFRFFHWFHLFRSFFPLFCRNLTHILAMLLIAPRMKDYNCLLFFFFSLLFWIVNTFFQARIQSTFKFRWSFQLKF